MSPPAQFLLTLPLLVARLPFWAFDRDVHAAARVRVAVVSRRAGVAVIALSATTTAAVIATFLALAGRDAFCMAEPIAAVAVVRVSVITGFSKVRFHQTVPA